MVKSLITGIDISHQSIKAVVLKPGKDTFTLVSYHQMPIEANIFTDNYRLNYQKIVKKLKELRKALPLFSRKVCLSVPDSSVISKRLQIDSDLSDEECQFVITRDFAQQSPVEVEALYLDFIALSHEKTQAKMDYQVYAIRKECIDTRRKPLLKSGFTPILINPHSHNLIQLWRRASRRCGNTNWLLMDVHSDCVALCFEREHLGVVYKEFPFEEEDSSLGKVLEPLLLNIELIDAELEGVWLSGEANLFSQLTSLLLPRLGLPCMPLELCDLFDAKHQPKIGPQFAIALGLALSGAYWLEKHHAA
ncbi:type IV pilus assembly protein PilM [Vibrio sp. Isolate24]|uniref:type IV pilus assembly protein PilM n=1 Tax=Vibrio sp. Isolate24 TaxID=2908534 RepID=UPI001EFCEC7B|nr:type IV pilus assembly protein PilM [Vibrio sp. Isolate24]MCG9680418.1 type IV pilus assembly protein PilM [Vibrio sp. Isolate24]